MNESATALRVCALGFRKPNLGVGAQITSPQESSEAVAGSGNIFPSTAADARKAEIKFAICAPQDKLTVRGWKVTDLHVIFFAKTR